MIYNPMSSAKWSVELEIAIEASIQDLIKMTNSFCLFNSPFCTINFVFLIHRFVPQNRGIYGSFGTNNLVTEL